MEVLNHAVELMGAVEVVERGQPADVLQHQRDRFVVAPGDHLLQLELKRRGEGFAAAFGGVEREPGDGRLGDAVQRERAGVAADPESTIDEVDRGNADAA